MSAAVLLQLLKKVDAARLEVMLDAEVLLRLMLDNGYVEADIKARLESGAKPGELLLELFDKRDPDELWESLTPRVQSRAKRRHEAPQQVMAKGQWLGLLLGVAALTVTAMAMLDPAMGSKIVFVAICGTITAAGGALLCTREYIAAGIIGGMVAMAGVTLTAWLAADHVSGFPSKYLVLAIVIGGALPGAIVGGILVSLARPKSPPATF